MIRLLTALALLLVGALQFGFLSWHSLWNNEFITLTVLDYDYPHLIAERIGRNHMPLYFVLIKAWTDLVGRSPAALHFPSALAGFLGIIVLWRLAVYLFGARIALFVLLVTGLNEIHLVMASDARMYSMLFLAMTLAMTGLIRYLEEGRRRWLTLLIAAGLFGMAVQLLFLFMAGIFAAWLIARRRDYATRWRSALLATLVPLLTTTPLIAWWIRVQDKVATGDKSWRLPALDGALRQTANIFLGDKDYIDPISYLHRGLAAVALVISIRFWWRYRREASAASAGLPQPSPGQGEPGGLPPESILRYRHYVGLWLLMWLVPWVSMALIGMRSRENLVNNWRYYLVLAPAAPLLLATALHVLYRHGAIWPPARKLAVALGVAMIAVCSAASIGYLRSPEEGLREAAHYLRDARQPGDAVLVGLKKARTQGFVYYGALEQLPPQLLPVNHAPDRALDWVARRAAGATRIWAVYYGKSGRKIKNPLHNMLRKHPEYFKKLDEEFSYGDTTLHVYEVLPAFASFSPVGEEEPEGDDMPVAEDEDDEQGGER